MSRILADENVDFSTLSSPRPDFFNPQRQTNSQRCRDGRDSVSIGGAGRWHDIGIDMLCNFLLERMFQKRKKMKYS